MKKILFTGGGSAGHVVPNLAIVEYVRKHTDHLPFYVGTGGIEKRLVQSENVPFYEISCPKFTRSFAWKNLSVPFALFKAVHDARALLREIRPDLVFSKGGFVALPVCLAAHKERIPVFTHESDLSAGLTTKLVAKKCRFVLTSFPETAQRFANGKCVGSPMRENLFTVSKSEAVKKFKLSGKQKTLLVFGGGSGSAAINEAVFSNLSQLTKTYRVLHVLGEKNIRFAPQRAGYTPVAYVENMGEAYACADLILCRAGSNTLFELAALKLPAVIVPLVKGSRGDQKENADYFEKRGFVRVLNEERLSADLLSTLDQTANDAKIKSALDSSPLFANGTKNVVELIEAFFKENSP